jgi:hypothetical protein
MIELRWFVEKEINISMNGSFTSPINRTLQYRVMENLLELGMQPPIWSEWMDVTTVEVMKGSKND